MSSGDPSGTRFNFVSEKPFFAAAPKDRPDVIAHRGGGGEWPGETIYAFREAIKLGVDVLEFDVRRTADDQIVLMHNSTVDETTDGTGHVRTKTLKELKKLNAAARWPGQNEQIPTLEEVLVLIDSHPMLRFNIEIKDRDLWLTKAVGELVCSKGIEDNVLLASGWDSVIQAFRRDYSRIATSASVLEILGFKACRKYRPNTEAIQWHSKFGPIRIINRGFVERAHRLALMVHGWTVNEPKEMDRMIKLGVDGIITDYPTTLLKMLKSTVNAR
jgi:glycerophosphoryl diester phosphodiesterase